MKKLNVGMIGYGFMGRTHSNAYRRVTNFFDVPYEPVLKVCCGLEAAEAEAFAKTWGYESHCTDWREVLGRDDVDIVAGQQRVEVVSVERVGYLPSRSFDLVGVQVAAGDRAGVRHAIHRP